MGFVSLKSKVAIVPLSQPTNQDRRVAGKAASQRGFVMIEMMLAVSIVGTAIFASVLAFSTTASTSSFIEGATTGEWVATSQIESIKTATYVMTPGIYASVGAPAGYAVANFTSNVSGGDSNIQIVTVTVTQGGETVYTTSALKVNR